MSSPWPAFIGYLYGTGRTGIVAPAQLADPSTCATNLIGTGPLRLVERAPNEHLLVQPNPNYWPSGRPSPDKSTPIPRPETIAPVPFAPRTPYYLSPAQARAAGFAHHDLAKAKSYVRQWSAAHGGQQLSFEVVTATDPSLLALTELVKEQNARAGINVTIK